MRQAEKVGVKPYAYRTTFMAGKGVEDVHLPRTLILCWIRSNALANAWGVDLSV